jgi:hypothetical protein
MPYDEIVAVLLILSTGVPEDPGTWKKTEIF